MVISILNFYLVTEPLVVCIFSHIPKLAPDLVWA